MATPKITAERRSPKTAFSFIRKRDGRIMPFDETRITSAVLKALTKTGEGGIADAEKVASAVLATLLKRRTPESVPGIEDVQDVVETQLILMDYAKTAKEYIVYRHERTKLRDQAREVPEHVKKLVKESKQYFRNPMSEFIYYRTYSRWIDDESRRETWIETINRYMAFMKERLGDMVTTREYEDVRQAILKQEAMPSMRLLWSAGRAARTNHVAAFNCSFIAPTKLEDFAEIMILAMAGAGVGFSVESQNVQQLPQIKRQTGKLSPTHIIGDSKEGWCNALTAGLKVWFAGKDIKFDYSHVRPQGSRLKTMGGKSSGPEPLRSLLNGVRMKVLAKQNQRLSTLDVHDIICKIGAIVVVGGVRRTALISLSDLHDEDMRHAKDGMFYIKEPDRAMANNSAVYLERPNTVDFMQEWLALAKSGSGERGIFNRGGLHCQMPERRFAINKKHLQKIGTNPCLAGDTLVYVADGRGNVPIKKLAEEGKDVPVMCLDDRGKATVRWMRNPRLTGKQQRVYQLLLDDGSILKATAHHKMRLKSGEYQEVIDLKPGDSLDILTRFEASIKDMFPHANERSSDYWWVNHGQRANIGEHRLISAFHYNARIPKGYVVHHRDLNAQNNIPDNLLIMTKEEHDTFHSYLMRGDANPMRRAHSEWNENQWRAYREKQSVHSQGEKNKNFSGASNEELRTHALQLTRAVGRRFSQRDWTAYAKENNLPQHFSAWRQNHLGGIIGLAQWAARSLGFDHSDVDPRVAASYKKYAALGYNCVIRDGFLLMQKQCEVCGISFTTDAHNRECGVCGISCGLKRAWHKPVFKKDTMQRMRVAHAKRKEAARRAQTEIYCDLVFKLRRQPLKKEWHEACKERAISPEIARASSPFRTYERLQECAQAYNHRVVSVEFSGYEDVYNGTVDEFHNFFVGAFSGKTKNGKQKLVYLNNLNCGEILLRSKQFCNLSEVVCRKEDTEESLIRKIRLATLLGTYQCMLTDYSYLSRDWKKNCDEERLLGVSLTGQWDCPAVRNPKVLAYLKEEAIRVNEKYAKKFGINASASITCVKPSGNVSQLVDAASGMHPRHAPHYIRRVRIGATDSLFQMMKDQKVPYHPEVGQAEENASVFVLEFPVAAPKSATYRNDLSAIQQLEHWHMVKKYYTEHNPSVTVSVGDEEWLGVADWLYQHWDMVGGLSFLPRDNHVYALAPYETVDETRYKELVSHFPTIDFSQIVLYERDDETQGAKELACVSGTCEIT